LREIYGLIFTYCLADAALLFFEIEAALVNVGDQGNGLGKVDVDRLVLRDLLVVDIGILDRAVFNAGVAARALVFQNVTGFFRKAYLEVPCVSADAVNFRVAQYFYIRMPADLDQFRCKYSNRAVVGREGFIELGHMAADAGSLLHEIDFETRTREIKRGLDAGDASAHNHDVAEIAFFATVRFLSNFI
jgi:hypothetical protein